MKLSKSAQYLVVLLLSACANQPPKSPSTAETTSSTIETSSNCDRCMFGYSSIGRAIQALSTLPDTKIHTEPGWTVLEVRSKGEIWSLTDQTHAAYPSIIKQSVHSTRLRRSVRTVMRTELRCLTINQAQCSMLHHKINQSNIELQQQLNKEQEETQNTRWRW